MHLGERRVDELSVDDVNQMAVALAEAGKKRETIRKSINAGPILLSTRAAPFWSREATCTL